ncbi:MAG: lytic murein transglycosylase B [Betaproteobacteria bacterium TMED156]|nr:MAG: lytic murein transglycosylase B [Betaproteobacteria bacterium TMED156]
MNKTLKITQEKMFLIILILQISIFWPFHAEAKTKKNWLKDKEVNDFIELMNAKHKFPVKELKNNFKNLKYQVSAYKLINPPKRSKQKKVKSWQNYKNRFVTKKTIENGRVFMIKHRVTLEKAAEEFGVPAKVIVGILGVETRYGKITGNYKVIDTLATFAFEKFKRKKFFLKELEHLLLLARENNIDLETLKGSFAGAMGIPQFMPSSWRKYAVDYDNDGKVNLFDSEADAIGSIANYLSIHGWRPNEISHAAVFFKISSNPSKFVANSLKAESNVKKLAEAGFIPKSVFLPPNLDASLIDLHEKDGSIKYWLATPNFFAVTKYNRSFMYAAAVLSLAESISPRL